MKLTIKIARTGIDLPVSDIENSAWENASPVTVDTYWNGDQAPIGRHFTARLLWSDEYLYVLFKGNQQEPIVISSSPQLTSKTMNLWDRDVCEIFLAPDKGRPRKYFEFETAPTGEWIDVFIDLTTGTRITDWEFESGMEAFGNIESGQVMMSMKIPWSAFGKTPLPGEVWLGNLFRCVGKDLGRGYLAWSPTMTEQPNFHVPERFGEFEFTGPLD